MEEATAASMAVEPFRIRIPADDLDDLRARLANTRWPAQHPGAEWSRGVPVDYLRRLASYWRSGFDWRAQEAKLNRSPQFTTRIDGQVIHFLHVRSPEPDALPMVITHGWPGSIAEFTQLIDPLVDPRAYGGDPADAFHLVIPSLPGFGFSGPVTEEGWNSRRIAAAWAELMRRLGYRRYLAQGGDFGAGISRELGLLDPEHVVAVHVNGGFSFPAVGADPPDDFGPRERARLARMDEFMAGPGYYLALQSNRPQTLAFALTDSPVGQLAWIVERFREWTDPARALPEDAVAIDQLLTNVSLYWFTATAGSAAGLYYEDARGGGPLRPTADGQVPSPVPAGVAQFTIQDVAIRAYDERTNNLVRWTDHDRGGHFAAMEAPDLLLSDVREFARDFRDAH